MTFDWVKNGSTAITGGNVVSVGSISTLAIVNAGTIDSGSYRVRISNAFGSVSSSPVMVTVGAPPSILVQPLATSLLVGQTLNLSVTAAGTAPLTYRWTKSGVTVPGATAATLTVPSAGTDKAGVYQCVVTNAIGSATTNPVNVAINVPPAITQQPNAGAVVVGGNFSFNLTAIGTGPLSYLWRKNGIPVFGGSASLLLIPGASPADAGAYDCVVTSAFGSVTSAIVNLLVNVPPQIVAPPVSMALVAGGTATFTVSASGTASSPFLPVA